MKFHVLAVDFDGTLAENGYVDPAVVDALIRLRQSGRKIVMVTGRLVKSVCDAFPDVAICDYVVAENGAVLFNPDTAEERSLAEPLPPEFVQTLRTRGVEVREVGRVIVATHVPFENQVLEVVRDLGLELQIVFNKGAVMILPSGVNKASGLRKALAEMNYSAHNVVGVGDAENDLAFLTLCAGSVAVNNALDAVKSQADLTVAGEASRGVMEVAEKLLDNDLRELHGLPRQSVAVGVDLTGETVRVPVYGTRMFVTGDSGGGKSNLAVTLLEQLIEDEYQTCVIDPEGDFQTVEKAIVLGTADQVPTVEEVMEVLSQPEKSCVVSLFAAKTDDQPEVFARLFRATQDHRAHTGLPHWNIVDEAHYPLSPAWKPGEELHPETWRSVTYVTAYLDRMPVAVLEAVDFFVAIAERPAEYLRRFCAATGREPPAIPAHDSEDRLALVWRCGAEPPFWLRLSTPRGTHQRHRHQYFDGDMMPSDRFRFRGPEGKLKLAAGNLRTFMQMAEGVDDATWLFHLRQGDYAQWFRGCLHDDELAAAADQLQRDEGLSAEQSRARMNEVIRKIYVKEL